MYMYTVHYSPYIKQIDVISTGTNINTLMCLCFLIANKHKVFHVNITYSKLGTVVYRHLIMYNHVHLCIVFTMYVLLWHETLSELNYS